MELVFVLAINWCVCEIPYRVPFHLNSMPPLTFCGSLQVSSASNITITCLSSSSKSLPKFIYIYIYIYIYVLFPK